MNPEELPTKRACATLQGATLQSATLQSATLQSATLQSATLQGATLPRVPHPVAKAAFALQSGGAHGAADPGGWEARQQRQLRDRQVEAEIQQLKRKVIRAIMLEDSLYFLHGLWDD